MLEINRFTQFLPFTPRRHWKTEKWCVKNKSGWRKEKKKREESEGMEKWEWKREKKRVGKLCMNEYQFVHSLMPLSFILFTVGLETVAYWKPNEYTSKREINEK